MILVTMVIPDFQGHGNESRNEISGLEKDRMIHAQHVTDPAHHGAYPSG